MQKSTTTTYQLIKARRGELGDLMFTTWLLGSPIVGALYGMNAGIREVAEKEASPFDCIMGLVICGGGGFAMGAICGLFSPVVYPLYWLHKRNVNKVQQ